MNQIVMLRGKLKHGERVLLRSGPAEVGGFVVDMSLSGRFVREYPLPPYPEPLGPMLGERIKVWSIATHRYRVVLPAGEGILFGEMPMINLEMRPTEELQLSLEALHERDDGLEITIYASVVER
jgi:hypothetical protein